MPFGKKKDLSTGQIIDFDRVYHGFIQPAVEAAGLAPLRGDQLAFGAIVHKSVLEAVIGADVFLADLTLSNANVMYELGVRHALRRGMTVLVASAGSRLPFDIGFAHYFSYVLSPDGELDDSASQAMRDTITGMLTDQFDRSDSPIFEFFPQIEVELPGDFGLERFYPRQVRTALKSSPGERAAQLKEAEEVVKNEPSVDPAAVLDLMRQYRDDSDWDGIIGFGDSLEADVQERAEVQQIMALALNRRNSEGDQERAISMMQKLIARTGGDSETFGILGRIYKDRYDQTQSPEYLERAIESYRAGFNKQPGDYYPAINLIHLLAESGSDAARRETAMLVPRVRDLVLPKVSEPRADFWDLATALELAVLSRDWSQAADLGGRMRAQLPADWMMESTLRALNDLADRTMSGGDRDRVHALTAELRPHTTGAL